MQWRGQVDVILEQRHRDQARMVFLFLHADNDGVQPAVGQALQQFAVRTQRQVDIEAGAAQFQGDHQLRDAVQGQGIQRTDFQAHRVDARQFAHLAHAFLAFGQGPARRFGKGVGRVQRDQAAALALEQGAAQAVFQTMQGAVHADSALAQGIGHPRQVVQLHKAQEHFQFFERDFFVDGHGRSCRL